MECQATHPIVMATQGKQAQADAHVPNANGFVARAGGQERALVMALLVVCSGCLVYRRGCGFRRPGNALHSMLMIA